MEAWAILANCRPTVHNCYECYKFADASSNALIYGCYLYLLLTID